jgi:hypothetical protein
MRREQISLGMYRVAQQPADLFALRIAQRDHRECGMRREPPVALASNRPPGWKMSFRSAEDELPDEIDRERSHA